MRVGPIGPSPSGAARLPPPDEMAFRSAPAQNAPPAPVRTATDRLSSAAKARNASASASAVARSTALRTSGRAMVTTVTGPSCSMRVVLMPDPPLRHASRRGARCRSVSRRTALRSAPLHAADRRVLGMEPQVSLQPEQRGEVDVDHSAVADGGDRPAREALDDRIDAGDDAGPELVGRLAAELVPPAFDHRRPVVIARLAQLLHRDVE